MKNGIILLKIGHIKMFLLHILSLSWGEMGDLRSRGHFAGKSAHVIANDRREKRRNFGEGVNDREVVEVFQGCRFRTGEWKGTEFPTRQR